MNALSSELHLLTNIKHRVTIYIYIYIYIYRLLILIAIFCFKTNDLTDLAKIVDEYQRNWDEKIDTILMRYRASREASSKHSPYYMLYQYINTT